MALTELRSLHINLTERSWQWMTGLADLAGIHDLVLADIPRPSSPLRPCSGPGKWIQSVLALEDDEDARLVCPRTSRPKQITLGSSCIPRDRSATNEDIDTLVDVVLKTGVRETVRIVWGNEIRECSVNQFEWMVRDMADEVQI